MDPASAGVAFVGFSASLITLVGLAADSWKTLYNLQNKLKHAKGDIRRLCDKLQLLQRLMRELEKTVGNFGDVSQKIKDLWKDQSSQMEQDMKGFKAVVDNLEKLLDGKSISKLNVRAHAKLALSDDVVAQYEGCLAQHIQFLELVLEMISRYVTEYQVCELAGFSLPWVRTLKVYSAHGISTSLVIREHSSLLRSLSSKSSSQHQTAQRTLETSKGEIISQLTDLRREQSQETIDSKHAILQSLALSHAAQRHLTRSSESLVESVDDIRAW